MTLALGVAALGTLLPRPARAGPIDPGTLWKWVLLSLNGGQMSINSMTSITGNVGISFGVNTVAAQKAPKVAGSGLFAGTTYVYGGTTTTDFANDWSKKDFLPNGGVQSGDTTGCATGITCAGSTVNTLLDQANTDATSLRSQFDSLFTAGPVRNLGLINDSSLSLTGTGGTNLYDVSWKLNNDVLTLNGTANDWFFFRTSTQSNSWAQSRTALNGVDPNHVWFYFTGNDSSTTDDLLVNKDATVFTGNIFDPTGRIEYHNPATFSGRIIASQIYVHSDANISAPTYTPPPPEVVPEPATLTLLGTGLVLVASRVRKRRKTG